MTIATDAPGALTLEHYGLLMIVAGTIVQTSRPVPSDPASIEPLLAELGRAVVAPSRERLGALVDQLVAGGHLLRTNHGLILPQPRREDWS